MCGGEAARAAGPVTSPPDRWRVSAAFVALAGIGGPALAISALVAAEHRWSRHRARWLYAARVAGLPRSEQDLLRCQEMWLATKA